MYEYQYYAHTNPETGACADNQKIRFGVSQYVAENLANTDSAKKAVIQWENSDPHRQNLLWDGHTGGAIACYSNYCVFLGVNSDRYGAGCY